MARVLAYNDPALKKHNLIAFTIEYLAYGVAIAFVSYTVVLPKLADDLGATPVFIGLISSAVNIIWSGMQFFAGSAASRFRKLKNMLWLFTFIGRPALVGYGLILFLDGARNPVMLQWLLLLAILIMFGTDSFGSTVWYDFTARTFPGTERPAIMAAWGVLNALAGLFVAGAISQILGPSGPGFPDNYALLFLFTAIGFVISWVAWGAVKNPPREDGFRDTIIPLNRLPGMMLHLLRTDVNLRRVVLIRLLMGLGTMAIPFYVVFGINELHLPEQAVALFITAQMVGTIGGNLVMGWFGHRWGPKSIILFAVGLYATAPVVSIILGLLDPLPTPIAMIFLWVYVAGSVITNASLLGASNYAMDIAPANKVPVYMSTANAISTLGMVGPLFGGMLVRIVSYEVMFAVSLIFVLMTLLVAARLEKIPQGQAEKTTEVNPID